MAIDILQRFLTSRLFDVGGDDKRVAALREAAVDLTAVLKAAPHRTATMTIVALDARIEPTEPLVAEVMRLLEKRWQSYAGAFTDDRLPTVARAILLQAISAAAGSESIAAAFSLTARSMLPLVGTVSDGALWTELVGETDRRLASRAEREWALPSGGRASGPEIDVPAYPALAAPTMPRKWLKERLEAASGPSNEQGETLDNANPVWPNNAQQWSYFFAGSATNAVSGAVDSMIKALVEKLNEREAANHLRKAVVDYVMTMTEPLVRTRIGLERRTSLLWWKEALYSPSAYMSYRDVPGSVAAALAALDASAQTGPFAPRTAEAMVREALRAIDPEGMSQRIRLSEHAAALRAADGPALAAITEGYGAVHREHGRAPLAALVGAQALSAEHLASGLGLPSDHQLSALDLGVWLFRDLQAAAATQAPPKRGRKAKP